MFAFRAVRPLGRATCVGIPLSVAQHRRTRTLRPSRTGCSCLALLGGVALALAISCGSLLHDSAPAWVPLQSQSSSSPLRTLRGACKYGAHRKTSALVRAASLADAGTENDEEASADKRVGTLFEQFGLLGLIVGVAAVVVSAMQGEPVVAEAVGDAFEALQDGIELLSASGVEGEEAEEVVLESSAAAAMEGAAARAAIGEILSGTAIRAAIGGTVGAAVGGYAGLVAEGVIEPTRQRKRQLFIEPGRFTPGTIGPRDANISTEAELRKAFEAFDVDGNGRITADEIGLMLESMGRKYTQDELVEMLSHVDEDGSGEIDLDEFMGIARSLEELDSVNEMRAASSRPGERPASAVQLAAEHFNEELKQLFRAAGLTCNLTPRRHVPRFISRLKLSNEAVLERERRREQVPTPPPVRLAYDVLCWFIDVVFENRPIQRFWFLETVARMPYFAYMNVLHLYETLGWWRSPELRAVHAAEEDNELHHLLIMESLGGDQKWLDRFLAQHSAVVYYWVLTVFFVVDPGWSYNFSRLIEAHAVDTYGEFVDANEKELKKLPPPPVAVEYYRTGLLYMFDKFQTSLSQTPPGRASEGQAPKRRPPCATLYDVFRNIADDENQHVLTMEACEKWVGGGEAPVPLGYNVLSEEQYETEVMKSDAGRRAWQEWVREINAGVSAKIESSSAGMPQQSREESLSAAVPRSCHGESSSTVAPQNVSDEPSSAVASQRSRDQVSA